MARPFLSPILAALALPALASFLSGCGGGTAPVPPPPPSAESLAAIDDAGGAPREELGRAIDRIFAEEAGRTDALLVLKRGQPIIARYGNGLGPKTRLPGRSMAQCVTGLMIGQLVSDGRLRLDETAPVAAWQRSGDPRGAITVRQLLQMRSGLRHRDGPGMGLESDTERMLYLDGRDDMAAYAEAQPMRAVAGQTFAYSAATPVILADLAARALAPGGSAEARRAAVAQYLGSRVLEPIGLTSMTADYDRAGTLIGSSMIHANAPDWALLGDFLRRNGSVEGAQILPRRWIEFMRRPSPRNPGYGALLWLNAPQPPGQDELWPARASDKLFACRGEHGQYLIGSPDQLLTIVRMGWSDGEEEAELHRRIGELIALFPSN
jgi:CubicO group peptidase (beta-lactamase class C family)